MSLQVEKIRLFWSINETPFHTSKNNTENPEIKTFLIKKGGKHRKLDTENWMELPMKPPPDLAVYVKGLDGLRGKGVRHLCWRQEDVMGGRRQRAV